MPSQVERQASTSETENPLPRLRASAQFCPFVSPLDSFFSSLTIVRGFKLLWPLSERCFFSSFWESIDPRFGKVLALEASRSGKYRDAKSSHHPRCKQSDELLTAVSRDGSLKRYNPTAADR